MKNLVKVFFVFFALCIIGASAVQAAEPAAGEETGSIIDFFGIGGAGCTASAYDTPCSEDPQTGIFSSIACRVMKSFNEGVVPLYCNIVSNPDYLAAIDAAMMIYVILLGFTFLFGMTPMTTGNLIAKLLKAIIIYTVVINADLYYSLIYNTVLQTPQDVVKVMLNSSTGGEAGQGSQNFFQYVDKAMSKVINEVFYQQADPGNDVTYSKSGLKIFVIGLALWQLGGDLVGGIFYTVTIGWVVAYFSIMIRYLLAMLSLMFLLMLGPIFIPTMLFDRLKYMGEEWMFMMINFILQIVLVVAFVLMVQGFFIQFYDMIKGGLEKTTMTQGTKETLVTFNNNGSQADTGAHKVVERKTMTTKDAEQLFSQSFGGDYKQKLPEMVFKLLEMLVIVLCSMLFLNAVPSLAAMLTGRPNTIRIFAGQQFGSRDKTSQANLLGQNAGRGRATVDQATTANEAFTDTPTAAPTP